MPFHFQFDQLLVEQLLVCKFTNIADNKDGCNLKLEHIEKFAIRTMKSFFLEEMSSKGKVSVLFKFSSISLY